MLPTTQEIDCDNNAKRKAPWAEVIKERVIFLKSLEITVIRTVFLQGNGSQENHRLRGGRPERCLEHRLSRRAGL